MRTVHIKTLGCKVNTFDTHALANQFQELGYVLRDRHEQAAITIINTCSVTENAEKEARYLARKIKRDNPHTKLVVTGCYAQTDSSAIANLSEVDVVVPNERKHDLAKLVLNDELEHTKLPRGISPVSQNKQEHFKSAVTLFDKTASNQTRAFVKIQDGCDGFCTYCLIPYARGASRSVPPERVLKEIVRLVAAGNREIVLTGIHIGDYGRDLATPTHFPEILKSIFEVPGLTRLRISSMEPAEISDEFLQVIKNYRELFCDHMHLPLQSGSDRILKRMRRTYSSHQYQERVLALREAFPEINIGADIIPGFPGETSEDHDQSKEFIESCQLNYLHVFPYSKRPNTAAAKMPHHVEPSVIKMRASELRDLSAKLKSTYAKRFLGKEREVLFEKDQDQNGRQRGITRNYLSVVNAKGAMPAGSIAHLVLKGFVSPSELLGVTA